MAATGSETPAEQVASTLSSEPQQIDAVEAARQEAEAYMRSHPDAGRLMQDLVAAILREKPDDPVKFASQYVLSITGTKAAAKGDQIPQRSVLLDSEAIEHVVFTTSGTGINVNVRLLCRGGGRRTLPVQPRYSEA